jgi:excinuclease ABC subunit B
MLPNNAVEYFVSYYDYYQPEAYIAQTDTYIEKDSSINEDVERLRHSATHNLLSRRDVVVVSTVSCIYGLGTPEEYVERALKIKVGEERDRDELLRTLVTEQYTRNDLSFTRGTFRVRGDTIEVFPVYEELACRIEMFGDEVERLYYLHPLTGEVVREVDELFVFPATHYVAGPERMERAIGSIEAELEQRLGELERQGKLLEAQRLRMRTTYDIEMMRQVGFCSGIENYSRHIDGRAPGTAGACLIDYFPDDFLLVIDESHVTGAADRRHVRGRHEPQADPGRARLPAALGDGQPPAEVGGVHRPDRPDRLPLGHPGRLRARPHRRRGRRAGHPAHRTGRPGGPGQADQGADRRPGARDPGAGREGRARPGHHADQEDGRGPHRLPARARHQGALPALRGRHAAPGGAAAPAAAGRVRRAGRHQPAARGPRPARGVAGRDPRRRQGGLPALGHVADPDDRPGGAQRVRQVHMYADTITDSMRHAIEETDRAGPSRSPTTPSTGSTRSRCARRSPTSSTRSTRRPTDTDVPVGGSGRNQSAASARPASRAAGGSSGVVSGRDTATMPRAELADLVQQLSDQMLAAARDLQFELAARLRDEIADLKKELRGMDAAGVR